LVHGPLNSRIFEISSGRFATIATLAEGHCLILGNFSSRVFHFGVEIEMEIRDGYAKILIGERRRIEEREEFV